MKRVFIFCLALCFPLGHSWAHETWLTPSEFSTTTGEKVEFRLTSGMRFPELDYAIRPERVATALFRLGGGEHAFATPCRGKSALRFAATFASAGLVTVWVSLAPKTLELSEEKVTEYFAEIDAPADVRKRWASVKGKIPWRETYTKCAKTFLAIGESRADQSWKNPVGLPLEIVPLSGPTSLKVGEKAGFRLLENGQPLPNIALGLIAEKDSRRDFQMTDSEGRATFTLGKTGRALFFAVHLRWRDDHWQSNFTTLTIQVADPAPQPHSPGRSP